MAFLKSFKSRNRLLITKSFYIFLNKFRTKTMYFHPNADGLHIITNPSIHYKPENYVKFKINENYFYLNIQHMKENKYFHRLGPAVYVFIDSTTEEIIEVDCYNATE